MNNTQAIYTSIIENLENLISEQSIEMIEGSYVGDEAVIAQLYDLDEKIKEILEQIKEYSAANTLYPNFSELYDIINENFHLLEQQTICPTQTLLYSLKLVRMLEGSFESIPEDNIIPFDEFSKFDDIPHFIDCDFYLHVGQSSYENTILFINAEDGLEKLIQNEHIIPDSIIILILYFLKSHSFEQQNKLLIIKTPDSEVTLNKAIAALKLHLVCSGKSYHKVEVTQRDNLNVFKNNISLDRNYNQFDDSLMIISEYNSRKELLNKYLSLYHLVENFMCRYPLVKLQSQYNGNMFSIRNFRDMYDDLDGKEIHMIRNFFKIVFSLSYKSNHFLTLAHTKFKELVSNSVMQESDIDNALIKLGMISKGTPLTYAAINSYSSGQANNELPQKLADMVYGIRNSIVHNKETEFHLSHEYMEPCIYDLINSYVLDILEKVLLDLMTEENQIIWYPHSRIKLFED